MAAPVASMMRPAMIPVGVWAWTVATAISSKVRTTRRVFFTARTLTKGLWREAHAAEEIVKAGIFPKGFKAVAGFEEDKWRIALLIGPF